MHSRYTPHLVSRGIELSDATDVKTKVDSDGKYIRTPYELCKEIISQLGDLSNKTILVVDTVEFITVLREFGAKKENITYIAPYDMKGQLATAFGATVINDTLTNWENKNNMKFDVVIGNPPYQSSRDGTTATEDLSAKFVNKCIDLNADVIALIIPSDWIGPNNSSIKNTLFKSNKLSKLCLYGNKWFNVAKDTCCIFYSNTVCPTTEIVDIYNNSLHVSLNNINAISLDNKLTSFLLKFKGFTSYLDEVWTHGNLYLNKLDEAAGTDYEFIKAVGRKGDPLTLTTIKKGIETTGYGKFKLVMPMVGDNGKIGQIKIATPEQVGGHSVVFLVTNNELESINLKSYLESKPIKLLIKDLKKSTPNSKGVFSCIPLIDITKHWTDVELYSHFKLATDDIKYIEENIK